MSANRDPAAEIAGALRRQTREQRDFLIVMSDAERNYYVQFPHPGEESPKTLYCEAVSDEWLEPADELGEAGAACLQALGWSVPGTGSPNWSREFRLHSDPDFDRIAATLVETLRDVYGYDGGPLELQLADRPPNRRGRATTVSGQPAPRQNPALDYLNDESVAAYFAAREHEAYYRSLKSVDDRRAFHDDLKAALIRLLEVTDNQARLVLDEIIARASGISGEAIASPIDHVRLLEPEGTRLLGLEGSLDFGNLRTAYRSAALRYHPDRGGSNEEMAAVNRVYEQLHALLSEQGEYDGEWAVSAWGDEAQTALDYLWGSYSASLRGGPGRMGPRRGIDLAWPSDFRRLR